MKKLKLICLFSLLSTVCFSQTIQVDTFKTIHDFEVRRYYNMDGDVFIVIDKDKWMKYERDTLPAAIKKQRAKVIKKTK